MEERLQKFLARSGVASRRAAEKMIESGLVFVNGKKVTAQGIKIDPSLDEVTVEGKKINNLDEKIYIILNKPKGYITTKKDQFAEKTVFDLLPKEFQSLHSVGRLDKESEGLLILTNDGELTNLLTHPRYKHKKEYLVLCEGKVDNKAIQKLRKGVKIDSKMTAPAKVAVVSVSEIRTELKMVLREGRKRQIRKMCEYIGCPVLELKRIRIEKLKLGNLEKGKIKKISKNEIIKV